MWGLSPLSFILPSLAEFVNLNKQSCEIGSKWGVKMWRGGGRHAEIGRVEGDEKMKRLWQSSIWPRLLSESSLACQISVLTVNSRISAEHRRVSCTMVSWFRIRLDEAIGWMTLPHFFSNSFFLSFAPNAKKCYQLCLFGWKLRVSENPQLGFKERNPSLGRRLSSVSLNYGTMRILLPLFPFFPLHCNNILNHAHTRTITGSLAGIMEGLRSSLMTIGRRIGLFVCAGVRG